MDEDVSVNLRAFKKKTSVINNARMIVTIADNNHQRGLYTRFQGSNYELALIVSAEGRPFMDEEKSNARSPAKQATIIQNIKITRRPFLVKILRSVYLSNILTTS